MKLYLPAAFRITILCLPFLLTTTVKASNPNDDTKILQQMIDSRSVVDLEGKTYNVSQLILRNNITLCNGTIISNGQKSVLYADRKNNITIMNVIIDGCGSSEVGAYFIDCSGINVSGCKIYNFKTIDNCSMGIYYKRVQNGSITNSWIHDVEGIPNGIIGDSFGACRAILVQQCHNVSIVGNEIYRILSSDDGDGIHCIDEVDRTPNNVVIRNNVVKDCTRRLIKIQAPGVSVISNTLITEADGFSLDYAISVYDSYTNISKNMIRVNTPMPIFLNAYGIHDITILNNEIFDSGYAHQGSISIGRDARNVVIKNNILHIADTRQTGVSIRGNVNNVSVVGNKSYGGRGLMWLRLDEDDMKISNMTVNKNVSETNFFFIDVQVQKESQLSGISVERNSTAIAEVTDQNDAIHVYYGLDGIRGNMKIKRNKDKGKVKFNGK